MALVEHIGPDLKAIDYTIPRTEANPREGALPGIGLPTPLTSTGNNIRDLQLCMRSVKRIDFSPPETYLLSSSLPLKTLNLHSRFRSSFGYICGLWSYKGTVAFGYAWSRGRYCTLKTPNRHIDA